MEDKAKRTSLPFQKRKQLERDIEHITAEMYRRNKDLADTNKTLSLLQTIDALVLEPHTSLKMVCEHITQAIAQATDYPFVGLFTRPSHLSEELTLYGWNGKQFLGTDQANKHLGRPIHLDLSNPWFSSSDSSTLLSLATLTLEEIVAFFHTSSDDVEQMLQRLPIKSVYAVKLRVRRRLVGVLVVGFPQSDAKPSDTETLLLDRLSETIGVAMDNKLLFEENQRVLKQMQEANNKLKALDETKDDFISMASHQLRTPLTSVKGYLSMVIEGDAGEVTPTQREMLSQAFVSSQRMVYLIADLLNVSRLKTGKFLIEAAPVNLADIVDEELKQLKETATSRDLKLNYDKPAKFPAIPIDETKTRQVIMNFVDNAIYYTPAGGHIDVTLVEKPHAIELRVTDSGIGVPKSEQPHLFTKFYRAENARKARPDGTGLGLFMAKKVIIAQGGSIIFETKDGKGSTFGFMLPKVAPKQPDEPAKPDTAVGKK